MEHIIRASADIPVQYEFIIVGGRSILGSIEWPEDAFKVSIEADIYPLQAFELADQIDGAIGEWIAVSRYFWLLRTRDRIRHRDPSLGV